MCVFVEKLGSRNAQKQMDLEKSFKLPSLMIPARARERRADGS
jgi:hypothetical protein